MRSSRYCFFMAKKKEMDVGKAFAELEEIAAWFEKGDPDLDAGLAKFERAMELSSALKERLVEAENTVREIRGRESTSL